MPCEHVKFPNGTTAILCTPRARRRKCSNGRCVAWASRECDFPNPKRASRTCDKPLCENCAIRIGDNVDHCPGHPHDVESGPEQMVLAL